MSAGTLTLTNNSDGRCVDLRVEMPENSLWNVEQARLAEEMRAEYERQQREAEQRNQPEDPASQSAETEGCE
ncbi:hypothetical protein FR762_19170 [Enterobacter sp. E76]|nr:hypothetical protein FR762_19170 [Enterobacter sp. E76]